MSDIRTTENHAQTWVDPEEVRAGADSAVETSNQTAVRPTRAAAKSSTGAAPTPKKKSISNNAFNFIVDSIMVVSGMCVLAATMILAFVFPAPSASAGYSVWGYGYDGWVRFLISNISIFLVLILLHIILHWVWVCMFVTSRLSKRLGRKITLDDSAKTIWGVVVLIVVLTIVAIFVGAASFALVEPT